MCEGVQCVSVHRTECVRVCSVFSGHRTECVSVCSVFSGHSTWCVRVCIVFSGHSTVCVRVFLKITLLMFSMFHYKQYSMLLFYF